jgi:hypothetical protein
MADAKISALPSATTPLAGTEVLPIVQSSTTVKATIANIVGAGTSPGSFTTSTSSSYQIASYSLVTGGLASYPSATGGLYFSFASTAGAIRSVTDNAGTAGPMLFQVGNTEVMRFNASAVVSIGTTSAGTGAILNIQSTTKGVTFPNMTTTQKNAITPGAGTVVFDTTLAKLCVYSGAAWQTITSV